MASLSIVAAKPIISHAPLSSMARRGGSQPPDSSTPNLSAPQLSGRPLSKHNRDNRPQILRAVRPFTQTVSSQKSLHKNRKMEQIAWGDGTCADPLPLLASEMNLRQPPASTPAAIEWLLLRAQGLSPVLDELDFAWSYSRKRTAPPRSPAAYLSAFERELRREALYAEIQQLETMLRPQCILPRHEQQQAGATVYPRCNWPRQGSILRSTPAPVETAAIALAMLAVTEAASPAAFARCEWPRAVAVAAAGARCEWPRKASAAHPTFASRAESPALAARCAWPRSSPAASTGPLCAWPRPTALSALPGRYPAPTAATIGAHCAWPHKSSSAAAEAARCLWPRAASPPLAAATTTPGARCNWPRAASAVASAETAPVERPRCAWPRQVANSDVQALLERALVQAEAAAPQAVEGPRHTEAIQRSAAAEELHGDMLPQIAREAKLEAAGRVFERRRVRAITLGA
ncbi:unnamed protein product [Closterium sp. NIES-64]|nr:unnamed protein product [Closterium sp. NIES-64]